MTANKMPEMPEMPEPDKSYALMNGTVVNYYTEASVIADRRACYLAGLEAAKACVPGPSSMSTHGTLAACSGRNSACDQTLTNLTALEQDAKK